VRRWQQKAPEGGLVDIMDVYPAHPQKFEALGFGLTGLGTLTRTLVPAFSASSRTVSGSRPPTASPQAMKPTSGSSI